MFWSRIFSHEKFRFHKAPQVTCTRYTIPKRTQEHQNKLLLRIIQFFDSALFFRFQMLFSFLSEISGTRMFCQKSFYRHFLCLAQWGIFSSFTHYEHKKTLGKSINTQHYAQSTQSPKFPDIWFNWEGFHTIPLYIHIVNFGM